MLRRGAFLWQIGFAEDSGGSVGGQSTHGMNGERVEWRWSERGEKPKQLASASQLPLPQDSDIECRARSV